MRSVWALSLVLMCGCGLPRDSEDTLSRARERGAIRVGVTDAPPFIHRSRADPSAEALGVEADLIRDFARAHGLRVQWIWGPLEAHYAALEKQGLDLAAGAITKDSPWKQRIGLTQAYLTTSVTVGLPPGRAPVGTIEGLRVAVEPGHGWENELRRRGAEVVLSDHPFAQRMAVAAPDWQLAAHDYPLAKIHPIAEEQHVLAIPAGQNAWLASLESHLLGREQELVSRLAAEARR